MSQYTEQDWNEDWKLSMVFSEVPPSIAVKMSGGRFGNFRPVTKTTKIELWK
jgi:hypothetical protein